MAVFYIEVMRALDELGIETEIQARPNEVDPSIPFAEDHEHDSYDAAADRGGWDRGSVEHDPDRLGPPSLTSPTWMDA